MDQWPSSYGSISALNLAVLCLTLRTYFICESNELYKYQSNCLKLPRMFKEKTGYQPLGLKPTGVFHRSKEYFSEGEVRK